MDALAIRIRRTLSPAYQYVRFRRALRQIPIDPRQNKKINLAIITGELEVGGVGRVLLNLIEALPKRTFNVYIFTTDPRVNNWAGEFRRRTFRVVDIPALIGGQQPQTRVQQYLTTYLARNSMDILFITNSTAGYKSLPNIKASGYSKSAIVYDLLHTHGRPQDDDAFLKISMPYDEFIDKRIVISEYLKRYFCSRYPVMPEKIAVIYNGLAQDMLKEKIDIVRGRVFLKLRDEERAITYLGRLQSDKSPDRIVEVAYKLRMELAKSSTFLAIVGEGELYDSLYKRSQQLGILGNQVRFYPFTNKPLDVAAASTFTIMTSDLEGIPMSALESMLAHTPVIAPAVGGLPEIIDDSRNGFLVNFDDKSEQQKIAALAVCVRRALELDNKALNNMRKQAAQKIYTRFTSMGLDYIDLFKQGVNKK